MKDHGQNRTNAPLLLVQCGYDKKITKDFSTEPPLAAAVLSAYLKQEGIFADLFDFQVQSEKEFIARIMAPDLQMVGFSAATLQIYRAAKQARAVRASSPGSSFNTRRFSWICRTGGYFTKIPCFRLCGDRRGRGIAIGVGEKDFVQRSQSGPRSLEKTFRPGGIWGTESVDRKPELVAVAGSRLVYREKVYPEFQRIPIQR